MKTNIDQELANWDKILEDARKNDREAEKNNQIIGRLLSYQAADGYAYYVVTKEFANGNFQVKLLKVYDEYRDSAIEELGRILPRRLVVNHLRAKDRQRKWIESMRNK